MRGVPAIGAWLAFVVACGGSTASTNVEGGATSADGETSELGVESSLGEADSEIRSATETADSSLWPDASDGRATVNGAIEGRAFSARGALAVVSGPPVIPVVVEIPATYNLTCAVLQAPSENTTPLVFANQAGLGLIFNTAAMSPWPPLTLGTYSVVADGGTATMTLGATYTSLGADCGDPMMKSASSGNATISAMDTRTISGSFDLTFPNGDHVIGLFSAPICMVQLFNPLLPARPVCVP